MIMIMIIVTLTQFVLMFVIEVTTWFSFFEEQEKTGNFSEKNLINCILINPLHNREIILAWKGGM